jgi:hypothetical protein
LITSTLWIGFTAMAPGRPSGDGRSSGRKGARGAPKSASLRRRMAKAAH